MVQQVRTAIYPQLARDGNGIYRPSAVPTAGTVMETPMASAPESASVGKRVLDTKDRVKRSAQKSLSRRTRFLSDPDALIQTGPGLPEWQWRSVRLHWNGPVDRTQQIRLWLISPIMNMALGLTRVMLLGLLIGTVLDLRNWRRYLPAPAATAASGTDSGDGLSGTGPAGSGRNRGDRLSAPIPSGRTPATTAGGTALSTPMCRYEPAGNGGHA